MPTQEFTIKVVVDPRGVKPGTDRVNRELDKTEAKASKLGATLRRAFAFLGGGALAANTVRTLAGFSQEMSTVGAVANATGEQFEALRETAKALGIETRFSATQAAEGMTFLARAGFEADEILVSIGDTLKLAQAGALGLGEAADIASNVLQGFRLEADEAARVVDVLALAANSSNTNVSQLGQAMKFVAPVAAGLGVSLETATAAAGALSDAGLQSSMAGTGLRRVLSELVSPSKKTIGLLRELGLTTDDVNVTQVGLTAALDALKDAGIDTGTALEIFGDRGGPAFEVLASSIPKVKAMEAALEAAGGTADRVAAAMDDNLNGAVFRLRSAFQGLQLELGDAGATGAFRTLFETLAAGLRAAARNIDRTVAALEGLAFVLGTTLARNAIPAAIRALNALRVAALTNPFTFLAGAITLAVGSLIAFRDELILSRETGLSVGDVLGAAFEVLRDRIAFAVEVMARAWPILRDSIVDTFVAGAEAVEGFLNEFGTSTGQVVDQIVEFFKRGMNRQIGVVSGAVKVIILNFERVKDSALVIWELMSRAWRTTVEFFSDIFGQSTTGMTETLSQFGTAAEVVFDGVIDSVAETSRKLQAIEIPDLEDASIKELGIRLAQINDPVEQARRSIEIFREEVERDFIGDFTNGVSEGFRALQSSLKEELRGLGFTDDEIEAQFVNLFDEIGKKAGRRAAERAIDEFTANFDAQGRNLFQVPDFTGQSTPAPASAPDVDFGPPPREQTQEYRSQKRALDELLTSIEREGRLLGLTGGVREAAGATLDAYNDLLDENVELSPKAIAATFLFNNSLAKLKDQAGVLDQLRGNQEDLIRTQSALDALYSKGRITLDEYANALREVDAALLQASGTATGGFDAAALASPDAVSIGGDIYEQLYGPMDRLAARQAALNELFEAGRISVDEYNRGMIDVNASIGEVSNTVAGGFSAGLNRSKQQLADVGSLASNTITNAFQSAEDAVVAFATGAEVSFRGLVASILQDLIRLTARNALGGLTSSLFGAGGGFGGLIGGLFGGARADGGPVMPGRAYVVGEEGPELFTPPNAGNITPAGETASRLAAGQQQQAPVVNVPPAQPIVNNYFVTDPNEIPAGIESPRGERAVMNVVRKNQRGNTV